MKMERVLETKIVKKALTDAGYTGVKVGHGTGTAWGWLHIYCDTKPGQDFSGMRLEVERIAQNFTGRHGEYDNITIS